MRASLNLAELKGQIEYLKPQTEREIRWSRYIIMTIYFLFGFSFPIFIFSKPFRVDKSVLISFGVLVSILMVVFALSLTIFNLRGIRRYSLQIAAVAPAFVHRPNLLNILWELRSEIWLIGVLIGVFILRERFFELPLIATPFYILPYVTYLIIQKVGLWIYKGGLSRINLALKIFPFSHRLLYFQSAIAYSNQNFGEAEAVLRRLLKTRTDYANPNVVTELVTLSASLMHQQRFEEIIPILEAAIKISPTASVGYISLAEWYLDQEPDAERAVELMDIALANTSSKYVMIYTAEHAISAQALALTGRTIRARASIETTLARVDKLPVAIATEVQRRVGYAYKALGEIESARTHFNRAIELAPNDLYSKLAKEGLVSLPDVNLSIEVK